MQNRYATIDIGTNTILMLIAKVDGKDNFTIIEDCHNIARLGEDFTDTQKVIKTVAKERAMKILENYRDKIQKYNVNKVFAVATSALREAENSKEILPELEQSLGCKIEIISGEKEAYFSYLGAVNNFDKETIVIDIGGGSTEIIIGNGLNIIKRNSIDIGAVKLTKLFIEKHPPNELQLENMKSFIISKLKENITQSSNFKSYKVYAVAGTPTTIAAVDLGLNDFERDKIEGHILTKVQIKSVLNRFINLSIEEIINKLKIHPKRADVITAGTKLLLEILEYLKVDQCIASTKGLRFGMMKFIIFENVK